MVNLLCNCCLAALASINALYALLHNEYVCHTLMKGNVHNYLKRPLNFLFALIMPLLSTEPVSVWCGHKARQRLASVSVIYIADVFKGNRTKLIATINVILSPKGTDMSVCAVLAAPRSRVITDNSPIAY